MVDEVVSADHQVGKHHCGIHHTLYVRREDAMCCSNQHILHDVSKCCSRCSQHKSSVPATATPDAKTSLQSGNEPYPCLQIPPTMSWMSTRASARSSATGERLATTGSANRCPVDSSEDVSVFHSHPSNLIERELHVCVGESVFFQCLRSPYIERNHRKNKMGSPPSDGNQQQRAEPRAQRTLLQSS